LTVRITIKIEKNENKKNYEVKRLNSGDLHFESKYFTGTIISETEDHR
jgi:hypothetical protein